MPVSQYYKPLTGNVKTPNPDDPVAMQQLGNTTYFDFDAQQAFGRMPAPVTQSETGAEAYLKALGKIPDMPRDLMRMTPAQRESIGYTEKPVRPAQSNVINRGGMGKAGRGGKSQFDVGPQFLPDSADWPGLEPLEMPYSDVSDKPWDLDDNTNADVAAGTKLDPQPEKPVAPDLNTSRGMFEALSKKYPDILTRNLEEMEQARVTPQDVEDLSDRSGLGSLFIAASKAASGAGAVGGKQAESIAPQIVQREDTLARQRLKDRLDVAESNMGLSAKAVDLAMKQINFADEREQYDPNSEVSRFARDFMRSEFEVNVPDNVPAYQLKQFLPAVVQKYQASERAKYQSALLGQKTEENLLNDAYKRYQVATQSGDKQAQIEAQKEIARIRSMAKAPGAAKAPKPEKMLGSVPADVAKVEMDLAKQFRGDKTVQAHQLMQNELRQLDALVTQGSSYSDQALITKFSKILDPGSVVRETEFAITERGGGLIKAIENYASKVAGGGRLQPSQRQEMIDAARALANGVAENYRQKRKEYADQGALYGARPEAIVGAESAPSAGAKPSGLSEDKKKRLEELRQKLRGGQ